MFSKKYAIVCAAAAAFALPMVTNQSASGAATWDAFVVRNGSDVNATAPIITQNGANGVSASIWIGSQKAAFGTDYFNGQALGDVTKVSYTRTDSGSTTTSPYINIWVTDGTNYAVIAPHSTTTGGANPSFGGVQPDISGNNVNGLSLQTLGFSVYENSKGSDFSWIHAGAIVPNGSAVLVDSNNSNAYFTLADISNLTVENPNDPGSGSSWTGGSGAAKGTNGFAILFGEIQADGNGDAIPYVLSNITVVPEPSALGLVGLAGLALLARRSRRVTA